MSAPMYPERTVCTPAMVRDAASAPVRHRAADRRRGGHDYGPGMQGYVRRCYAECDDQASCVTPGLWTPMLGAALLTRVPAQDEGAAVD